MISSEGLKEFIKIYQEEFGVLLTSEEALEKALPVLNLVKTLIQLQGDSLTTKDSVDERDREV